MSDLGIAEFILGVVAGMVVHQLWVKFIVWRTLREMAQGQHQELNDLINKLDEVMPRMLPCRLELVDDVFFLYRKDNQEFVAQGRTPAELTAACDQRYPNHLVVAQDIDPQTRDRFQMLKSNVGI